MALTLLMEALLVHVTFTTITSSSKVGSMSPHGPGPGWQLPLHKAQKPHGHPSCNCVPAQFPLQVGP